MWVGFLRDSFRGVFSPCSRGLEGVTWFCVTDVSMYFGSPILWGYLVVFDKLRLWYVLVVVVCFGILY